MIDLGLVVSAVVAVAVVVATSRAAPALTLGSDTVLGAASPALLSGLVGARLVAVALDDPTALARPRDLLFVRGGMEFWAGAAAAAGALWLGARRSGARPLDRLGDVAFYALMAYGVYEATCVVRDGCFGPFSRFGLRPAGVGPPQVPVGMLVGAAVWGVAVMVRKAARRSGPRALVVAVTGVGAVRFLAGLFLPRIGRDLSRPQVESLAITIVAAATAVVGALWSRRRLAVEAGPGALHGAIEAQPSDPLSVGEGGVQ